MLWDRLLRKAKKVLAEAGRRAAIRRRIDGVDTGPGVGAS